MCTTNAFDPAKAIPEDSADRGPGAGPTGMQPWGIGDALAQRVAGRSGMATSSLADFGGSALALALGRPNREQVTTVRQSTPTTIQALELTNGETLSRLLKQGAEHLMTTGTDGPTLVDRVFTQVHCPVPPPAVQLSVELVGRSPQREGHRGLSLERRHASEFQLTF